MKDFAIIALFCVSIVSTFGLVTFLMYKDISGWGWLLFCAVLIFGSIKISVD